MSRRDDTVTQSKSQSLPHYMAPLHRHKHGYDESQSDNHAQSHSRHHSHDVRGKKVDPPPRPVTEDSEPSASVYSSSEISRAQAAFLASKVSVADPNEDMNIAVSLLDDNNATYWRSVCNNMKDSFNNLFSRYQLLESDQQASMEASRRLQVLLNGQERDIELEKEKLTEERRQWFSRLSLLKAEAERRLYERDAHWQAQVNVLEGNVSRLVSTCEEQQRALQQRDVDDGNRSHVRGSGRQGGQLLGDVTVYESRIRLLENMVTPMTKQIRELEVYNADLINELNAKTRQVSECENRLRDVESQFLMQSGYGRRVQEDTVEASVFDRVAQLERICDAQEVMIATLRATDDDNKLTIDSYSSDSPADRRMGLKQSLFLIGNERDSLQMRVNALEKESLAKDKDIIAALSEAANLRRRVADFDMIERGLIEKRVHLQDLLELADMKARTAIEDVTETASREWQAVNTARNILEQSNQKLSNEIITLKKDLECERSLRASLDALLQQAKQGMEQKSIDSQQLLTEMVSLKSLLDESAIEIQKLRDYAAHKASSVARAAMGGGSEDDTAQRFAEHLKSRSDRHLCCIHDPTTKNDEDMLEAKRSSPLHPPSGSREAGRDNEAALRNELNRVREELAACLVSLESSDQRIHASEKDRQHLKRKLKRYEGRGGGSISLDDHRAQLEQVTLRCTELEKKLNSKKIKAKTENIRLELDDSRQQVSQLSATVASQERGLIEAAAMIKTEQSNNEQLSAMNNELKASLSSLTLLSGRAAVDRINAAQALKSYEAQKEQLEATELALLTAKGLMDAARYAEGEATDKLASAQQALEDAQLENAKLQANVIHLTQELETQRVGERRLKEDLDVKLQRLREENVGMVTEYRTLSDTLASTERDKLAVQLSLEQRVRDVEQLGCENDRMKRMMEEAMNREKSLELSLLQHQMFQEEWRNASLSAYNGQRMHVETLSETALMAEERAALETARAKELETSLRKVREEGESVLAQVKKLAQDLAVTNTNLIAQNHHLSSEQSQLMKDNASLTENNTNLLATIDRLSTALSASESREMVLQSSLTHLQEWQREWEKTSGSATESRNAFMETASDVALAALLAEERVASMSAIAEARQALLVDKVDVLVDGNAMLVRENDRLASENTRLSELVNQLSSALAASESRETCLQLSLDELKHLQQQCTHQLVQIDSLSNEIVKTKSDTACSESIATEMKSMVSALTENNDRLVHRVHQLAAALTASELRETELESSLQQLQQWQIQMEENAVVSSLEQVECLEALSASVLSSEERALSSEERAAREAARADTLEQFLTQLQDHKCGIQTSEENSCKNAEDLSDMNFQLGDVVQRLTDALEASEHRQVALESNVQAFHACQKEWEEQGRRTTDQLHLLTQKAMLAEARATEALAAATVTEIGLQQSIQQLREQSSLVMNDNQRLIIENAKIMKDNETIRNNNIQLNDKNMALLKTIEESVSELLTSMSKVFSLEESITSMHQVLFDGTLAAEERVAAEVARCAVLEITVAQTHQRATEMESVLNTDICFLTEESHVKDKMLAMKDEVIARCQGDYDISVMLIHSLQHDLYFICEDYDHLLTRYHHGIRSHVLEAELERGAAAETHLSLSKECDMMMNEVIQMAEKMNATRKEIQIETSKSDVLGEKLASAMREVDALALGVQALQQENSLLSHENLTIETEKLSLHEENVGLGEVVASLHEAVMLLEDQNVVLQHERQKALDQLQEKANLQSDFELLMDVHAKIKIDMETCQENIEKLTHENLQLEVSRSKMERLLEASKNDNELIDELHEQLDECHYELRLGDERVLQLTAELTAARLQARGGELEALRDQYNHTSELLSAVKQDLAAADDKVHSWADKCVKLSEEKLKLTEQIVTLTRKSKELEAKLGTGDNLGYDNLLLATNENVNECSDVVDAPTSTHKLSSMGSSSIVEIGPGIEGGGSGMLIVTTTLDPPVIDTPPCRPIVSASPSQSMLEIETEENIMGSESNDDGGDTNTCEDQPLVVPASDTNASAAAQRRAFENNERKMTEVETLKKALVTPSAIGRRVINLWQYIMKQNRDIRNRDIRNRDTKSQQSMDSCFSESDDGSDITNIIRTLSPSCLHSVMLSLWSSDDRPSRIDVILESKLHEWIAHRGGDSVRDGGKENDDTDSDIDDSHVSRPLVLSLGDVFRMCDGEGDIFLSPTILLPRDDDGISDRARLLTDDWSMALALSVVVPVGRGLCACLTTDALTGDLVMTESALQAFLDSIARYFYRRQLSDEEQDAIGMECQRILDDVDDESTTATSSSSCEISHLLHSRFVSVEAILKALCRRPWVDACLDHCLATYDRMGCMNGWWNEVRNASSVLPGMSDYMDQLSGKETTHDEIISGESDAIVAVIDLMPDFARRALALFHEFANNELKLSSEALRQAITTAFSRAGDPSPTSPDTSPPDLDDLVNKLVHVSLLKFDMNGCGGMTKGEFLWMVKQEPWCRIVPLRIRSSLTVNSPVSPSSPPMLAQGPLLSSWEEALQVAISVDPFAAVLILDCFKDGSGGGGGGGGGGGIVYVSYDQLLSLLSRFWRYHLRRPFPDGYIAALKQQVKKVMLAEEQCCRGGVGGRGGERGVGSSDGVSFLGVLSLLRWRPWHHYCLDYLGPKAMSSPTRLLQMAGMTSVVESHDDDDDVDEGYAAMVDEMTLQLQQSLTRRFQ